MLARSMHQMLKQSHNKTQLLREMASLEQFHELDTTHTDPCPMSISKTSETFCPNTTKKKGLWKKCMEMMGVDLHTN